MTTGAHASRVALVTGAASGIGRQIAEHFACGQGASVVIADRDGDGAAAAAREIVALGGRAQAVVIDLGATDALQQALPALAAPFGAPDILVNNAGVAATIPAAGYPLDHWQTTLAINLTAPMLLTQWLLPSMRDKGWGRVVNIASISGVRAGTGRLAYGTSKAALIALTKQFAIEVAEWGITVNAIAPGPVDTPLVRRLHGSATRSAYSDMVPMRRYGTPADIADAVVFLASEQASYITGHTLAVDGGFLASGVMVRDLFDQKPAQG